MSFEKNTVTVPVSPGCSGFRADRALCALAPNLTRRAAKTLFHAGAVRLNGKSAKGSERVEAGDRFEFPDPAAPEGRALFDQARAPRLTTSHGRQVARLYEDDAVLVLNKPAEIPVHRNQDGLTRRETLEDVLERAYPPKHLGFPISDFRLDRKPAEAIETDDAEDADAVEEQIENRKSKIENAVPGFFFCHRLDMETTGCLLVAKNPVARDALIRDFEKRRVGKQYLAIAVGSVPWERKVVTRSIKYIRKEKEDAGRGAPRRGGAPDWARRKMSGKPQRALKVGVALEPGDPAGKACETAFTVLRRYKGYTVLKCEPRTGRMHQIRVHLASEGFPLAYDQVYGRRSPLRLREFDLKTSEKETGETIVLNRLPLHAWKLSITHPVTRERMELEAPLPGDLKEFMRVLKKFRSRQD